MPFRTETDALVYALETKASSASRVARHTTLAMVWVLCVQAIIYFAVEIPHAQLTFIMSAGAALIVALFGVRVVSLRVSEKARREISAIHWQGHEGR